jgi:hypothetical protein
MRRRLNQLLSCYLAGCLLIAGAVGLNPLLHQQIEHGGNGPIHVHSRALSGGDLSHSVAHPSGPTHHRHHGESDASTSPESSPENIPDHEHDSLPQLLVSGLILPILEIHWIRQPPVGPEMGHPSADPLWLERQLDLQTASRAPPHPA